MAAPQDIIVRYQAEVDEAVKNIDKLAKAQDDITKAENDQAKQAKSTAEAENQATKKRLDNLKKEEAELKRLTAAKKQAFTVKDISAFNAKINESQKRISLLKGEISGSSGVLGQFGSQAKNVFAGIAAGAIAAFSTQAIINFAQSSVRAFLDAEKNAERLRFAITTIGGESEVAFDRLIKQSSELQKITVFSDDSIQQAQAALAAFGLTADEVERLIPKLADFATITSQDISSAAQQIGAALEGNGREFKKYGIEVDAAATRTENLNEVMDGLVKFQGSAAAATQTLSGQMEQQKNQVDDLQEAVGEKLAPAFNNLYKSILEATLGLLGFNKAREDLKKNNEKAVADNFAKSAQKIRDAGGDVLTVFQEREREIKESNDRLIKENELYTAKITALTRLGDKERSLELFNLKVRNREIIESNRAKLLEVQKVIQDETLAYEKSLKAQQEFDSRFFTLDQLRLKSTEDLIELKATEAKLEDRYAKDNVKNIELILKAREESAKQIEAALQKLQALQIANIEDEKQRRIAAFEKEVKDIEVGGKLRSDIILELEKQLVKDLNDIDKKRDFTLLQPINNTPQIPDELTVPLIRTDTDQVEFLKQTWLQANEEILASSIDLFGELTNLYNTFSQNEIDRIAARKTAELESIDAQIEANKVALENRQITNNTEEALNKKLAQDKVEVEKKADKEIRKIKKQQAILDRANAIFQIALNTAIALSNASNLATFGALSPIIIGLAAAQTAAVLAAPIPAFAKGTKGKQGSGMALVGEIGAEAVYLPHGSKVVPNRQTAKYAGVVDAMINDNLEQYIHRNFVAPKLIRHKQTYSQAPAEFTGNSTTTKNGARYYQAPANQVKFPDGMNINNYDDLATAIASKLQNGRRRS